MRIRPLLSVVLALCLAFFTTACSGYSEAVQRSGSNVTYDDIRNTGKANDCPTIGETARGSIALTAGGSYELRGICMHPVQVFAKEEPKNIRQEAEFVEGKVKTAKPDGGSQQEDDQGIAARDRYRTRVGETLDDDGDHDLDGDARQRGRQQDVGGTEQRVEGDVQVFLVPANPEQG